MVAQLDRMGDTFLTFAFAGLQSSPVPCLVWSAP